MAESKPQIRVYGAGWCPSTTRTLQYLKQKGIEHEFIDVEADPKASAWVKEQNNGREKKPTVDVAGRVLSEPSNQELQAAIDQA